MQKFRPIAYLLVASLLSGCSVSQVDEHIKKRHPGALQSFNLMNRTLPPAGIKSPFGLKLPPVGIKTPFGLKLPPVGIKSPFGLKLPPPK
jgi:hypothetical protein